MDGGHAALCPLQAVARVIVSCNPLPPRSIAPEAFMVEVHAYIEVTDAASGIAFYCDGLGLTVKRRLSPSWIELDGANLPLFLLAERPSMADLGTRMAIRTYERHWTPVHLDFIVAGLDAVVAK